jgi:hypothetical protein
VGLTSGTTKYPMTMIDSIHIDELRGPCTLYGWSLKRYVESFKRQYPDIMIIGEPEDYGSELQEGQE